MASHKNILTMSTIMYSKFYPKDIVRKEYNIYTIMQIKVLNENQPAA